MKLNLSIFTGVASLAALMSGAFADTATTDPTTAETGTTGEPAMCGWFVDGGYYECGNEGADPGGTPIECPDGLVEGDSCETTGLTGAQKNRAAAATRPACGKASR